MRDIEVDSELRPVATLRRAARERSGPLLSIDVADALLDERRERVLGLPDNRRHVRHLRADSARDPTTS
jgi:hypothetical protein